MKGKVRDIISRLYEKYSQEESTNDISLFHGSSGDMLLHYELYEWSGNVFYKNKYQESLDRLLEHAGSCTELNFSNGFAGVFHALAYMGRKGMTDLDEDMFRELDPYMDEFVKTMSIVRNYDLLCGLIGVGLYYIERDKLFADCRHAVNDIIDRLLLLAEGGNGEYYWRYYLEEHDGTIGEMVNLGLLHGMTSILSFLMICVKEGYIHGKITEYIIGGLLFIEKHSHVCEQRYTWDNYVGLNPCEELTVKGYVIGYCYGDLGIANTFLNAASLFGNDHYYEMGTNAFEKFRSHIANYKIKNNEYLCFCHGIASLIYFTNSFRQITGRETWDGILDGLLDELVMYIDTKKELPLGMLNGVHGVILSVLTILKPTPVARILLLN